MSGESVLTQKKSSTLEIQSTVMFKHFFSFNFLSVCMLKTKKDGEWARKAIRIDRVLIGKKIDTRLAFSLIERMFHFLWTHPLAGKMNEWKEKRRRGQSINLLGHSLWLSLFLCLYFFHYLSFGLVKPFDMGFTHLFFFSFSMRYTKYKCSESCYVCVKFKSSPSQTSQTSVANLLTFCKRNTQSENCIVTDVRKSFSPIKSMASIIEKSFSYTDCEVSRYED